MQRKFVAMAPVFDTGNALFYDREVIPGGDHILDIAVNSFKKREVNLLEYVSDKELVDTGRLDGFWEEAGELLKKYTAMPGDRADRIADTIRQKTEYLRLFQQGKKIWKREKYW